MTILLHPKIADLVNDLSKKKNGATADEAVNEILWLALRSGAVDDHYSVDPERNNPNDQNDLDEGKH